jgi:hypothetical protein
MQKNRLSVQRAKRMQSEMSEDIKELLQGKFPELKKLKLKELREEVQMWRNLWSWIPSAVKYYVSRTGSTVGVTIRNYKRFIGPLLETEWDLKGIELGVYDKVYDQSEGIYYWERKIIKVPIGGIVQFDWIAERVAEEKLSEAIQQAEENPTKVEPIEEVEPDEDKPPA